MRLDPRIAASFGLLAAFIGCAQPFRASVDRRIEQTSEGVGALVVETENGNVTLETDLALTQIVVEAHLTCTGETDDEALARAEAATVSCELAEDGRTARVFVTFPDRRRAADGCSLLVRAPRFLSTRIETANGDVRATSTSGDLAIETSNGSVVVDRHDGTIAAETSNGDIRLVAVSGVASAKSSNGTIALDSREASIERFDLDTSNGGVEVAVGAAFHGTIDAATSNGSVDCHLVGAEVTGRRSEKTVRLGDGARSRARTSNGSIVLK